MTLRVTLVSSLPSSGADTVVTIRSHPFARSAHTRMQHSLITGLIRVVSARRRVIRRRVARCGDGTRRRADGYTGGDSTIRIGRSGVVAASISRPTIGRRAVAVGCGPRTASARCGAAVGTVRRPAPVASRCRSTAKSGGVPVAVAISRSGAASWTFCSPVASRPLNGPSAVCAVIDTTTTSPGRSMRYH
jgi:hypothetical protein